MDYTGDKEGFFIYWYENPETLNLDSLYMTAKFFNGNVGQYTKFLINDQLTYTNQNTVPNDDFYYRVLFNYTDKTYQIVSTVTSLIRFSNVDWYEYLNPDD
jgi:hypothetical protein